MTVVAGTVGLCHSPARAAQELRKQKQHPLEPSEGHSLPAPGSPEYTAVFGRGSPRQPWPLDMAASPRTHIRPWPWHGEKSEDQTLEETAGVPMPASPRGRVSSDGSLSLGLHGRGPRTAAPGRSPRGTQARTRRRPAETPAAPHSQHQNRISPQGRHSRPSIQKPLRPVWGSPRSPRAWTAVGVTCRPPWSSSSDWSPLEGARCTPAVRDQQTRPSVWTRLWGGPGCPWNTVLGARFFLLLISRSRRGERHSDPRHRGADSSREERAAPAPRSPSFLVTLGCP